MTVDRKQIRRDAELWRDATLVDSSGNALGAQTLGHHCLEQISLLSKHCLALLTELEQAEKERDVARDAISDLMSVEDTRLAKVPALTEAIRHAIELRNRAFNNTPVRDDTRDAHFALEELRQVLRKALNAYEGET